MKTIYRYTVRRSYMESNLFALLLQMCFEHKDLYRIYVYFENHLPAIWNFAQSRHLFALTVSVPVFISDRCIEIYNIWLI